MLRVSDLGRTPYRQCWDLQRELLEHRVGGRIPDTLLLTEHDHVYTLGTAGDAAHVLASPSELAALGATVVATDRGGDVTYHGPGQLVAYPVLDLSGHRRDLAWYLRSLEESVIRVLARFGIQATRSAPFTGVWVGSSKICAIGVKTSRWVTMHGLALNVTTDLRYFAAIVPCGIAHRGVTSMEQKLGGPVALETVSRALVEEFCTVFDLAPDRPGAGTDGMIIRTMAAEEHPR